MSSFSRVPPGGPPDPDEAAGSDYLEQAIARHHLLARALARLASSLA